MYSEIHGGDEMKLGLFTDSHDSNKEISCVTRRPSLSWSKIQQAMEAFQGVDAVICLGDLTDDCIDPQDNAPRLKALSDMIRSYGIDFYSLMGNHDCNVFTREEFNHLSGSLAPFCIHTNEKALVFLDANYSRTGESYIPGCVDWTDTAIPDWQIEKLAQILNAPENQEVIIFVHQNLDPYVQHQHIIANHAEIRQILENSGKVRKVYQGHYHPGHTSVINGIEYHTLAAMCEGENNSYKIIEI